MTYARASKAFGFCDRTGFRYPLKDLVYEVRDGQQTGFRVGRDVVDPDHPQNFVGRLKVNDPQSLFDPRPDTSQDAANALWGWNPVGNPAQSMVGSVGVVTVNIEEAS
jgi:hypothetical protein